MDKWHQTPGRMHPWNVWYLRLRLYYLRSCKTRSTKQMSRWNPNSHLQRGTTVSRNNAQGLKVSGSKERKSVHIKVTTLCWTWWKRTHLFYLAPEKFATRRSELAMKKSAKEIAIDQTSLIVKDKTQDLSCATTTELDTTNAMRRRALAFDLVKACSYHTMNSYHVELFDHLHLQAPPGYSQVSLAQLLRADRAAWLHIAEKITTLRRDEHGTLPLEDEISKVLAHPAVSFHLLPLPLKSSQPEKPASKTCCSSAQANKIQDTCEACSCTPKRQRQRKRR